MINQDIVVEGIVRYTKWWSANEVWDCGLAFTCGPVFQEAYEIRAALLANKVMKLKRGWDIAHAFSDRALLTQGCVDKDMYYMGYGNQKNADGIPNCSCVADASSTANVILETVKNFPDSPKASDYLSSVKRFIDKVLNEYTDENGVISVGILSFLINPYEQYWCACSLFTSVLIAYGEITGDSEYLHAAIPALEYLATADYKTTKDGNWNSSPTEVILYWGEGMIDALLSPVMQDLLSKPISRHDVFYEHQNAGAQTLQAGNRIKADNYSSTDIAASQITLGEQLRRRWVEFCDYLCVKQEANGLWQETRDYRCYQTALSWLILKALPLVPENKDVMERVVERQLSMLLSKEGIGYFGLFNRPFATALAHLSFAGAGEYCLQNEPDAFNKALSLAQASCADLYW